jgi:hypothetical protein
MRSVKLTGVAAMTLVALLAVTASSALARTGPRFYVEGTLLGATQSVESNALGAQVLSFTGVELECSAMSLEGGNLLATNPGTGEETLVYSGCTFKGKTAAECEVRTKGGGTAGQLKTVQLASELVFRTQVGPETDTLFKPKSGTEFVSIEFKGTSCPLPQTRVNGSVAVENEATEHITEVLTAPASSIHSVWNAAGTVQTRPKLTVAGGFTATYEGKAEVWLTGAEVGKKWGIKE